MVDVWSYGAGRDAPRLCRSWCGGWEKGNVVASPKRSLSEMFDGIAALGNLGLLFENSYGKC